eukprot:8756223-Pyramimonas_sp.AAC.1
MSSPFQLTERRRFGFSHSLVLILVSLARWFRSLHPPFGCRVQVCGGGIGVWYLGGEWRLEPADGETANVKNFAFCSWILEPPPFINGLEVKSVQLTLLDAYMEAGDVLLLSTVRPPFPSPPEFELRTALDRLPSGSIVVCGLDLVLGRPCSLVTNGKAI